MDINKFIIERVYVMWALLDTAMKKFRGFNVADVGIFKICLITFGFLIGLLASDCCKKYKLLFTFIFLFAYLYVIYRFMMIDTDDSFSDEQWD